MLILFTTTITATIIIGIISNSIAAAAAAAPAPAVSILCIVLCLNIFRAALSRQTAAASNGDNLGVGLIPLGGGGC